MVTYLRDPLKKDNVIRLQKGTEVTVIEDGINLGLKALLLNGNIMLYDFLHEEAKEGRKAKSKTLYKSQPGFRHNNYPILA